LGEQGFDFAAERTENSSSSSDSLEHAREVAPGQSQPAGSNLGNAAEISVGKVLSHYRVLEKLGAGGMGVVHRAHDERLRAGVECRRLSNPQKGISQ
jgi:serine/threonine protein kinase